MGLIFFPYTDKSINNTILVIFIFELGLDYFEKNTIISLSIAGIAQLVEHHVANVNVASSNLVSRSRFSKRPVYQVFFYIALCTYYLGRIANRLCSGLQIHLDQFDSGSGLHTQKSPIFIGLFSVPP